MNNVKYNAQIGFVNQVKKTMTAIMPAKTSSGAYHEGIIKKEVPVIIANRMVNPINTICNVRAGLGLGFLISLIQISFRKMRLYKISRLN